MTASARGRLVAAATCVYFALLGACAERTTAEDACAPNAPAYSSRDSAGVTVFTNREAAAQHTISDSDQLLRLGESEQDGVLFGRVTDATRLGDGTILVADGRSVSLQLFDSSGALLRDVGSKGAGPGQYMWVSALLRTTGDSLLVYDGKTGNLTTLDATLLPVSRRRVSRVVRQPGDTATVYLQGAMPKGVLGDGALLVSRLMVTRVRPEVTNISRDSLVLQRESAADSLTDSLAFVLGQQRFEYFTSDGSVTFGDVPLGYVESIAVGARGFFVGDAHSFDVAHYSPNGTLQSFIRVCQANELLDERQIDVTLDAMLDAMRPAVRTMEEPALRQLPRERMKPAHLELLTDARGQLWAREFTYTAVAQRWRVFDQTGRWQLTVQLPENTQLLEAGEDYVLVRNTSATGVESVRLYRFSP